MRSDFILCAGEGAFTAESELECDIAFKWVGNSMCYSYSWQRSKGIFTFRIRFRPL